MHARIMKRHARTTRATESSAQRPARATTERVNTTAGTAGRQALLQMLVILLVVVTASGVEVVPTQEAVAAAGVDESSSPHRVLIRREAAADPGPVADPALLPPIPPSMSATRNSNRRLLPNGEPSKSHNKVAAVEDSRSSRASTLQKLMTQRRQQQNNRRNTPVEMRSFDSHNSNNEFNSRQGLVMMDGGEGVNEETGRSMILGNMIEQLSNALHRNLVRSRASNAKMEGREQSTRPRLIARNNKKVPSSTAVAAGLGGGNQYYRLHPEKKQLVSLPECATQQVCNAVYVRLNMTQPLCSCPVLTEPCSASTEPDDQHTIELKMGAKTSKAVTMIKTCEPVWSVRDCRAPRDWSILALQNTRTGKAHYLVICKCPDGSQLDGPLNHDQPSYAQVPGIRVYGMMCITTNLRATRRTRDVPEFPWSRITSVLQDPLIMEQLERSEDSGDSSYSPLAGAH